MPLFLGSKINQFFSLKSRWLKKRYRREILALAGIMLSSWLLIIALKLSSNASQDVDAFFVLGGSIRREMHVATLAKEYPQVPVLISGGSWEPCVWLIFDQRSAPKEKVWLEKCADSTFGNFFFSVPILEQWGVHKVKLITSPTHLPRAKWLAQISFGIHGIWVETELAEETGIPGNRESNVKTALDVTRTLLWAVVSQFVQPQCPQCKYLPDVDIETWQKSGFRCEYQALIDRYRPK